MTNDPHVSVRTASGWRNAVAEIGNDALPTALSSAYVQNVGWFCYPEYLMWRRGRPTAERIRELHQTWIDTGVPVTLHLDDETTS